LKSNSKRIGYDLIESQRKAKATAGSSAKRDWIRLQLGRTDRKIVPILKVKNDKLNITDLRRVGDSAYDANLIAFTDAGGNLVATNVKTALEELAIDAINAAHREDLNDDWFPVDQCLYRNEECDNTLATASGTEITISSIDTVNDTITLSWLPYRPSIWSPTSGREWALLDLENHDLADPGIGAGDYQNAIKITGGTYATKVLNYVNIFGTETNIVAGHRIALYNPWEEGTGWTWINSANPVITTGAAG